MNRNIRGIAVFALSGVLTALLAVVTLQSAAAVPLESTNYTIDASEIGNTFGGNTSTSTNYKLTTASGGETVVGNGASGSYKLGEGYVAQLEQSIQLNVQPDGLIAHYSFDENTGTKTWDSSANNNYGSLAASPNTPTWQTGGKIGGALYFSTSAGTSFQRASIPHTTTNNIETVTVSLWIKRGNTNDPTADLTIFEKWSSDASYPYAVRLLACPGSGCEKIQFVAKDTVGNFYFNNSTNPINDTNWHHIVGTRTPGGNVELFIDGVSQGTVADTSTPGSTTNSSDLYIGARSTGTIANSYDGYVDNIKIFNRVLSADEVDAEYDAQNAGYASGLGLGSIVAGSPNTADYDAVVLTDAPGYNLAVNQDHDLQSGANTIPAISGSIASPAAWVNGTTKGLGFTLQAAPSLDGKWGSGANYAAFPGSGTTFYTRSGFSGGTKDTINMQIKADIGIAQALGAYTNTVTITGTLIP